MRFYINVMKVEDAFGEKYVVAVCDAELLGKTFKEGEVTLSVNVEFFKGFEAYEDEVMEYLKKAYTAMIVGERAVNLAIRNKLVHPEAVMKVSGVPYAQIVRF